MTYDNVFPALFIERPNRFIAHVELDGKLQVCHVKNTGRCKELLVRGCEVFVQKAANTTRKTAYDLIAVRKNGRLINMDSNAPNKVFGEYLQAGGLGFAAEHIKAEQKHGDSRFDFYFEHEGKKCFAEIKGVTLEQNGIVYFPDAPTERGIKHLRGLIECRRLGFEVYAVFIIQMDNVLWFEPNRATHPQFAEALEEAYTAGVKILAFDCDVSPESLKIKAPVEVRM